MVGFRYIGVRQRYDDVWEVYQGHFIVATSPTRVGASSLCPNLTRFAGHPSMHADCNARRYAKRAIHPLAAFRVAEYRNARLGTE